MQHAQCHEEAFAAISAMMKKRCEEHTALQTVHGRIDELASRVGQLECEQIQVKQLVHNHWQEVQQLCLVHSATRQSKEKVTFDVFDASSNSLESQSHDMSGLHEDSLASSAVQVRSSTNFCEENDSTEMLSLLLKDLQEERTFVVEMLENVRQEKLDVIAAMHTFQLQKANAVEEIMAAQNTSSPRTSRRTRRDQLVESCEVILPQPSLLSPGHIGDNWQAHLKLPHQTRQWQAH